MVDPQAPRMTDQVYDPAALQAAAFAKAAKDKKKDRIFAKTKGDRKKDERIRIEGILEASQLQTNIK